MTSANEWITINDEIHECYRNKNWLNNIVLARWKMNTDTFGEDDTKLRMTRENGKNISSSMTISTKTTNVTTTIYDGASVKSKTFPETW